MPGAAPRRAGRALGESPAASKVAERPEGGRVAELPPGELIRETLGRQPAGAGIELGRSLLGTSRRCPSRSALELSGDGLARLGRREREVPGSLFRVADDVRESRVQEAAALRACGAVDRGSEQRVGEAHAASLRRQNAGLLRVEQSRPGVVLGSNGPQDRVARGSGQRRSSQARLAAAHRELAHALAREGLQVSRHWQRPPSCQRAPVAAERAGDLERQERIPSRGLGEPGERRA